MPNDFKYSDRRYNRDNHNRLIDLKGVTLFKYLKNVGTKIFMRIMGALHVEGNLTVGGNNIKDRSGKTVISFNNTGGIDKIGDDTPSSGQFLKWDGSKAVWDAAAGTTYSAGTLLDLSTTTFNVDLTEASAQTIVAGDYVLFLDGGTTGSHAKGSINDVATLFAGSAATTGLSASSGVLSVSDLHPVGVDGSANQLLTDDGDGTITSEDAATLSSSISTTTLELMSPADSGDKLGIEVAEHGATTITTVDDDADAAHLTLDIDGNIILDSHEADSAGGGIMLKNQGTEFARFNTHHAASWLYLFENAGATTDDYMTFQVAEHGATILTTNDAAAAAAHFEIAADGNITLDAAGDVALECGNNGFTCDAGNIDFSSSGANRPTLQMINSEDDATGPSILLKNNRDGNGLEDDDILGEIKFVGEDASGNFEQYGSIIGSVVEADHGDEAGQIAISVANDGTERNGITMTADKGTAQEVDVTIANGASSTTTIAGNLLVTGKALVGWHGSYSRIKILPRDFVANDIGRPLMINDNDVGSNELFLFSFSGSDMFAYVPIPTGYKATHVKIFGSDTGQDFYVYEGNIDSKTIVDIATGTTSIGTEKTLGTQLVSDTTNYVMVRVTSDGSTDEIHGGYVTIAAV